MLNISIKAEPVFNLFGFFITNSLLTSVIVLGLLFLIAKHYFDQSNKRNKSGLYYAIHFLVSQIHTLFKGVVGGKINIFFPLIGAFFLYILLQNWFGLLPGVGSVLIKNPEYVAEGQNTQEDVSIVNEEHSSEKVAETEVAGANGEVRHEYYPLLRAASADLNTTLALGLIAVIAMQIYGVKFLGWGGYLKKYFNFANPINFFLGLLEIISEISRVVSFSFRLFGNIFAGEVLLLVIAFLVPVLVSFPFYIMEIFVGFVQALVFAMLVAVFLNIAVAEHH